MSDSRNGPFSECLACGSPLPSYTVKPMKPAKGYEDKVDYNGAYEDLCPNCKAAIHRAYDYDYTQFDGMWDFSQDIGPAYEPDYEGLL